MARDRLFQLELWRRQAAGTVAQILGPRELKRDIGNRLFVYRGDLTQEFNWYHPHGAAIVEAFVNGINAYIPETQSTPALLTPEFQMLGLKPGKWTPAVVIARFNGLFANLDQEINIALAVRTIGVEKVKELYDFQPDNPKLEMDPAIVPSLLPRTFSISTPLSAGPSHSRRTSWLPDTALTPRHSRAWTGSHHGRRPSI